MKKLFSTAISLFFFFLYLHTTSAQNIRFFIDLTQNSPTSTTVSVFAQTTSGTENLTGFTVYLYYDNAETTVTSFDASSTTGGSGLNWGTANQSNILHQAEDNPGVAILHSGFFFYQNFDNALTGNDISTVRTLLLTVDFDHTVGNNLESGSVWLAQTTEVPSLQYVNNLFSGFDVQTTGNQGLVLPVELLGFDAKLVEEQTYLQWQTASELNNAYFLIERSTDGRTFQEIDKVIGAGNSNTLVEYSSWDEHPVKGKTNYYRLKQVDTDGTFAYSDIRSVTLDTDRTEVSVYPNPARNGVHLNLSGNASSAIVRVLNQEGKIVLENTIDGQNDLFRFNVQNWTKGMYVIQVVADGQQYSSKLIVVD